MKKDGKYDVIVIGSGMGGLTCGAVLAKKGKKVKVLEKHSVPGGYCTAFKRKDFIFDIACHMIGECGEGGTVHNILTALDLIDEIEFKRLDSPYKVIFPEESFRVPGEIDETIMMLSQRFPQEEKRILKLFDTMKNVYEDLDKLPRLYPTILRYKDKVFQEILDEHMGDSKLKAFISAVWTYQGYPPSRASALQMSALLTSLLSKGSFYCKGGSKALSEVFVKGLEKFGGEIELKTMVNKIMVKDGKAIGVETENGRIIYADYVISNADAIQTFLKLVGEEALESAFVQRLKDMEISLSCFNVYLGVNLDINALRITDHETIVHKTLDSNKEYEAILKADISDLSYTITVPTLTDPGLAPNNNHCVIIFAPIAYHVEGMNWKEEKARVTEELIKRAEEVIPHLSRHIVVKDSATPLTLERYTLNSQGAFGGWANTPVMMFNRPEPITPIRNLYLTGHWTFPGSGISGVISSGWMVAQMVL